MESFASTRSTRLERSFEKLESLRRINGGYLASPNPGKPDGTGRYNVFWLRDIMYATYANEYLGNFNHMIKSFELVMTIMLKYRHKLLITKIPKEHALHARFHPNTLEELSREWGHHQLDVIGLFLYKTGDLIKKGHQVIKTMEQRELIRDLIQYVFTFRWETYPDYGMWEEGPEIHSSSLAAILAGLTMWHDEGYYNYKYKELVNLSKIVPVSDRYFETGEKALKELLPRESGTRDTDMAQLSLIWPYNIIEISMQDKILSDIENQLLREKGVIRYKDDWYFNSQGKEAEWPLGIAWLSIVHNKLASRKHNQESIDHLRKSKSYLERLDNLMVDGCIPELYTEGKPNDNCPLAWAHSFHIIALQSFINTVEELNDLNLEGIT
ncbi:MAG: glycoside hydrolase family 15 protein [Candidatus Woesearchaeota archaeon]